MSKQSSQKSDRPTYEQDRIHWESRGLRRKWSADLYFFLLASSWQKLLAIAMIGYLLINLAFAGLYYLNLEGIVNARPDSFSDAFFFSVQTFSTIGFGAMSPQSPYAHFLVTIESFAGLVAVALATGLIYAKFARPTAAVAFSRPAVIQMYDGVPMLIFRLANERQNEVLNVKLSLSALINEETAEGLSIRRVRRLPLVREDVPIFTMAWTAMHRINEESPLYTLMTDRGLSDDLFLLIATFEGSDSTLLQTVQARHFYRPQDISFGRQFVDMLETEEGRLIVHYDRLHKTVPTGGFKP